MYAERYVDEPFVELVEAPRTQLVRGANSCHLNVWADPLRSTVIVAAALDNLVKGAAGQAIQNANLMLGMDEWRGCRWTGCGRDRSCQGGRRGAGPGVRGGVVAFPGCGGGRRPRRRAADQRAVPRRRHPAGVRRRPAGDRRPPCWRSSPPRSPRNGPGWSSGWRRPASRPHGLADALDGEPAGDARLGLVGRVVGVDGIGIRAVLAAGAVPVVSPMASGLNVNADLAAVGRRRVARRRTS